MNYQNIPRDLKVVKRAFLPKRGSFSFFDWSQIEPRLFAYFAATALKDPTIADWYREGRDVYREIAASVYKRPVDEITDEQRQLGKVWFLMSLYGAGPRKMAAEIGMPYAEALEFYQAFHAGLPQIRALSNPKPRSPQAMRHWKPGVIERVISKRGYLKTAWGRHLHVPPYGDHKMLNTLIQGSAADLMKATLIRVDRVLRKQDAPLLSRMVSVIHDEIIFDGPEHEIEELHEVIPPLMREDWLHEVVPIEVDHEVSTTSWADKISYEEWLAGKDESMSTTVTVAKVSDAPR